MLSSANPLEDILAHYQHAFQSKLHTDTHGPSDVLMEAFGVTPEMKTAAAQYWGRELGMCWERLVRGLFACNAAGFGPPLANGAGEPCDFTVDGQAVDTKYRLGSGDSGTLRKLADNAEWLRSQGFSPVMLFLREDSLDTAISRMRKAGWRVLQGDASFDFITEHTGQDLRGFLRQNKGAWQAS